MTPSTLNFKVVIFLKQNYNEYVNLLRTGLTAEQAIVILKLSKPPPGGVANYQNFHQLLKQQQMKSFKDFLR